MTKTITRTQTIRFLNALLALILMGTLLGAYYQQYFKHEMPCPLCILQRLAMFMIAIGAIMNLKFGPKPKYYGLSLLGAFFGAAVSLRQICLHICPGFPVFGIPVFGLSLYTWAFVIFCCSILGIILLLFMYPSHERHYHHVLHLSNFEKFVFWLVFLVLLANFITTFDECGLGFCRDVPWPQP